MNNKWPVPPHLFATNGAFTERVASEQDNGDTSMDSPDRNGPISAETFTVVKRAAVIRRGGTE
ncbi:hypothetical protein DN523_26725 [Burkholderia multivorans]|uniref:hypothetical protein n=1 Tax=Burkholderia multivorans TaxID=87883 RepID=UPI0009C02B72|nr:hypothetical protein [Burkholderia multivorans]MBN6730229.1 hypothetical protein [Burkholderia multivorans]MBN6736271.1 hypothetical protein [Burkholderia multivorans]MBN7126574.1 hypothetical protein [Burkholderia multivorans]MBN8164036.1 hypothetical protein [Burkholderia multivorans]MBN8168565.1 hypothetical protein [Burkholderia multivorans]